MSLGESVGERLGERSIPPANSMELPHSAPASLRPNSRRPRASLTPSLCHCHCHCQCQWEQTEYACMCYGCICMCALSINWYFGLCLTKYGYIQLYTPAAWPLVAMRMREGPKPCLWPAVGLEELLDQVALPLHLSHCFLSAPVYVVTYLDYFVFIRRTLHQGIFDPT